MEPCSSLQRTWDFLFKKKYNSLPPQININSYQSQSLFFMFKPCKCCLTLLWVLSNSLTLVRTLSYSHDQDHVHVHSQIASISIHSQNKTPSSTMTLSPRLPSRIWAIQKEIKRYIPKGGMPHAQKAWQKEKKKKKRKDAYPKKVCHMSTRPVKKREDKKYICMSKKKNKIQRER